jgi:hypothetical protein
MRLLIVGGILALAFSASLTPASAACPKCSTLGYICRVQQCGDIPAGRPSPAVAACIRKCVAEKKAAQR